MASRSFASALFGEIPCSRAHALAWWSSDGPFFLKILGGTPSKLPFSVAEPEP
jgi:hypothetical protein